MDSGDLPAATRERFFRDLTLIHRLLRNMGPILRRLRASNPPVRSVVDIGCGDGAALAQIRDTLGAKVTGIDLRPPERDIHGVEILIRDATRDALPEADAAISLLTLHHLTDDEVVALIRNASRSCRRLICLDLVRHRLPYVLFNLAIAPLIHKVAADDGRQSIRRAFTPPELANLVASAISGTSATFDHTVSRYYSQQVIDIRF